MPPDLTGNNVQNPDIRSVLLQAGDPGAFLNMTRNTSSNIGRNVPQAKTQQPDYQMLDTADPNNAFGLAMMQMLQRYQQYGQNTANAATQEQAQRVLNPVAQNMIGASPSQQQSVIGAQANAVGPTIGGAQQLVSEANTGINNMRTYMTEIQNQQDKIMQNARQVIQNALTTVGGDAFKGLDPKELALLEKQAGYPRGFIQNASQTIKDRELQLRKQQNAETNYFKALAAGVITPQGGGTTAQKLTQQINPQTGRDDSVLQNVPSGTSQIVKQLVDYRIPLPTGFALRSPYWQNILSLASQYDPSFDATQYNVRLKLRQDFTSGKSANNIRSLNTAIGHLYSFSKAADSLMNSPIQLWNRIKNQGLTAVGDPRVSNFNTTKNAVSGEMATIFKQTSGSDQEIQSWKNTVDNAESPEQLKGAIEKMIELMGSRMDALTQQYETGMGKPKDFKFLSQKSDQILQSLGVDPNNLDPLQGSQPIMMNNQQSYSDPLGIL